MKNYIIVELDGTLADTSARQHLMEESWEAYHGALASDVPFIATKGVLQGLDDAGYSILIVTGRPAKYDKQTIDWLNKHNIPVEEVLMRETNDYRAEAEVKIDLLTNFFGSLEEAKANVLVYFEGKDKTVEALRNVGFETWAVR